MKDLSSAPLFGRLLTLPTNIRVGQNRLPGRNTLAYLDNSQVTKKIKGCEYGPSIIKFFLIFTDHSEKFVCHIL